MKRKIELVIVIGEETDEKLYDLNVLERMLRALGDLERVELDNKPEMGGAYNVYSLKMTKKSWTKVGEFMGAEPIFVGKKNGWYGYTIHL